MPATTTRLLGSGYTGLFFGSGGRDNIPIAFAQMYTETAPELVGESAKDIHPMDWEHPAEIMTSMAMTGGEIEIGLFESWSENAWNRLQGAFPQFRGLARNGRACDTILDIVRGIEQAEGELFVAKLINTPFRSGEKTVDAQRRVVLYRQAKIISVGDGDENVDIETMEQVKNVTFRYTHRQYRYHNASRRFGNRGTNTPNANLNEGPQSRRRV